MATNSSLKVVPSSEPDHATSVANASVAASKLAASTTSLAVNAAFMWEIKSVNEELWMIVDRLLLFCRRPHLISRRAHRLVDLLEQFQDLVAMQFTLEEAYGYFDDPAVVEPQVSATALTLRQEHVTLYQQLMKIVDKAQDAYFECDEMRLVYKLPTQLLAFIEQFRAHDRRECELTLSAMNDEIGVGD